VNSAWLRGRDAHEIGAILERRTDHGAVALSLGGAKKVYAHTDPNEDAALVVAGSGGMLVAVADGHGGVDAAEIALEHLYTAVAPRWVAAETRLRGGWESIALDAMAATNAAIAARAANGARRRSRTTLACAVVRPGEEWLFHVAIGDSHVYQVTRDGAYDLSCERSESEAFFLGVGPETLESLRAKCTLGAEPLAGTRAVAAVTDGLSERHVGVEDPDAAVLEAWRDAALVPPGERAEHFARGILERALEAHRRQPSGDNVAAAVAWLAP